MIANSSFLMLNVCGVLYDIQCILYHNISAGSNTNIFDELLLDVWVDIPYNHQYEEVR